MTEQDSIINENYEILPDDYTQYDLSFKIIVIGDSGVGKSCLTNQATKHAFDEKYNATVGFEFYTFNIKLNDKIIKLQIWDTCGQELYRSLITNFYRNSSLAIIVYAVDSKDSFENVETWLRELRTLSNPDTKVFLIGNKIDLEKERVIKKDEGESYAKTNKLNKFIEASAKTGINAQQIFIDAAKLLFDDYIKYHGNDFGENSESVQENVVSSKERKKLQKEQKKAYNNKKKKCCF